MNKVIKFPYWLTDNPSVHSPSFHQYALQFFQRSGHICVTFKESTEPSQTFIHVSCQDIYTDNKSYVGFDEVSFRESIPTKRILQVLVTIISFLPSTRIPTLTGGLHRGALHRLTRPTHFLFPWLTVTPTTRFVFPYLPAFHRLQYHETVRKV